MFNKPDVLSDTRKITHDSGVAKQSIQNAV